MPRDRTRLMPALFASALLSQLAIAPPAAADTDAAFEWIKRLAGRWEGLTWWSTNPDQREEVTVTYSLTGRGSAVVENFSTGAEPSMTSVYHRDGEDLRMTHYCSARNQPRLKATRIDMAGGIVEFSFVDITNLSGQSSGHVSGVELRRIDENHITVTFTFTTRDGREILEYITLQRAAGSGP